MSTNKQDNTENSKSQCESKISIHFFYVTFILLSIIILLATFKWTELKDFTNYISTAATITSLVLGILAIIYAYISNDSLSQTNGALRDTAEGAKDATALVKSLLNDFKNLEEANQTNNKNVSQSLASSLEILTKTSANFATQKEQLQGLLDEIPGNFQNLNNKIDGFSKDFASSASNSNNNKTAQEATPDHELAKRFISRSSLRGNLLGYWCLLSAKHDKSFNLWNVYSEEASDGDYEYGYFIAMSSAGLLGYKRAGNKDFKITSISPEFEKIKEILIASLEKKENNNNKINFLGRIERCERYFDVLDNKNIPIQ
jgi:hypothetical protein